MAFDEGLAERVRGVLDDRPDVVEKRMFGGIAFMVRGHMCVGLVKDDLMVRVGPERHEESLKKPHVRPMDFTGKPMTGYVYVGPAGVAEEEDLERWVRLGAKFVATLPKKEKTPKSKKPTKPSRKGSR